LYCQQRNDFVGIGDGSGAREERATATQKSHETLQLPIPLQQTHVFFPLFFFDQTTLAARFQARAASKNPKTIKRRNYCSF
jgi:hypothetical protein